LRSQPARGNNVIDSLPRGAVVEVEGQPQNGFAPVVDPASGKKGWAARRYLRDPKTAPSTDRDKNPADKHLMRNVDGEAFIKGAGDAEDIDPNDVNQGDLGDCYFLASMAAVARANPELIRKLIKKIDQHHYEVTLYVPGPLGVKVPYVVPVNTEFPADMLGPAYAQLGDGPELWPLLLEKALAKAPQLTAKIGNGNALMLMTDPFAALRQTEGSYNAIVGGFGEAGLDLLTPGEVKTYCSADRSPEQNCAIIHAALQARHPVTAGLVPDLSGRNYQFLRRALAKEFAWFRRVIGDDPGLAEKDRHLKELDVITHHEYAPSEVDMGARTISLQNPWGFHHITGLKFEDFNFLFVSFSVANT
jgi:hypothetical protein